MLTSSRFLASFFFIGLFFLMGRGSEDLDAQQNPLGKPAPKTEKKPANPLAKKVVKVDPWLGLFQGEKLTVDLRAGEKGAYRGEFRMGDQSFAFQGAMQGKELRGKFKAGDDEFEFVAELSGDKLSLETGDVTYLMTRGKKGAVQPPKKAEVASSERVVPADKANEQVATPVEKPVVKGNPGVPLVKMKSFDHPIGFTFQHPEAWKMGNAENGIVLIPNDVKKDNQGQPLELFLVSGDSAEGVKSAADPNVAAYFDGQVPQWYPGLRRAGKTESLKSLLGEGTIYAYEGKIAGGVELRLKIYVAIHKNMGIFLAHAGVKDSFNAREAISRQMFSSFGWKAGKVDPALVGHWYRSQTSSSGFDPIGGSVGGTTKYQYLFSKDGTVAYSAGTRLFGTVKGAGGSVSIDDPGGPANVSRGTWSVSGSKLIMLWSGGGVETYEYKVFPHQNSKALKLLVPGEKKPQYFEPR